MRARDYVRLSGLSLLAKKKTSLQTILGLSFGLALLFPMLFIAIGFYGGFSAEINANPANRTMRVMYANEKTDAGNVLCYDEYEKEIDKIDGVKNNLKYDYYYINNEYPRYASYSLDGGEIKSMAPPTYYRRIPDRNLGLQVIDKECANKPFLDMDYYVCSKPLVSGHVFSKGDASKGEIMVSTKFLKDFELDANTIVGSKLTVYGRTKASGTRFSCEEDSIVNNLEYKSGKTLTYFKDYKIVGVYNSTIYARQSPRYYSIRFDDNENYSKRILSRDYFWISSASLGENGVATYPKHVFKNDGDMTDSWYYYEDDPVILNERVINDGYAFLPMGLGMFSRSEFLKTYTKTHLVEFFNFEYAKYGYEDIIDCYHRSVTGEDFEDPKYIYPDNIAPYGFFTYQAFFERFIFICLGFGVFGGVIFIATLLNLINTLHFSVESSKGFLGICRAHGMKRKEVTKLFFNQISLIFACSYLFAIAVGGAGCIVIKNIFDKTLASQIEADSEMVLTLRWWYIPISLLVLIGITLVLSIVISHLLVRKVNKTPVLEILSEEGRM